MAQQIQAIRGTKDILPDEVIYWQFLEKTAREILSRACYQEMRTPIFEQTSLFERGIGEATDVVGKEMYSFMDRGERPLTLRPEGTAGAVRAFIQNKLGATGIQRLWYCGAMFRYERPQAGRQRQFHQIGLELLGVRSARADVEAIAIATDILTSIGLTNLSLQVNSVGSGEDRQRYRGALVDYFTPYKDDLDPDSQDRLTRNPLRILDSKDPKTQEIGRSAPSILDYLGADSQQHFSAVCQLLTDLNISYELNPRLVRGLDYYTDTAFEIQSADLGAQATVCGGGRYDGLVTELGGADTPAIGWAMGMERLVLLLQQLKPLTVSSPDVYFVSRGEKAEGRALVIAQQLRQRGITVELDLTGSNFAKQFKRADRSNALLCLILGDGEVESNTIQIKYLETGQQETVNLDDITHLIEKIN
ncbi:MAG: histidine--tRNA ligase [Cyanobacterium sp. T60_A2020_053]|nr:histidine--tRNA ligase [Cyanobacterium sp. T60_A2020_053]